MTGKGGDVIFKPGAGAPPEGRDGAFVFEDAKGTEVMRIESGGKFYINGVMANAPGCEPLIYAAFKIWLASCVMGMEGNASAAFFNNMDPGQDVNRG